MKLATLLNKIQLPADMANIEISGLSLDSRKIQPGDLFCALSGSQTDGTSYIQSAIDHGAMAVVTEKEVTQTYDIPIIVISRLAHQLGEIAARFYQHPSKKMLMIGVTGTNGKTSVTQLTAQAFDLLGQKSAFIGTVGYGIADEPLTPLGNTTPDAISLQKILSHFQQSGVQVVAMEVSSHALDQGRVHGIDFDLALLTNITQDHLDYHRTLEHYAQTKKKLFEQPLKTAIFNADDPLAAQWKNEFSTQYKTIGYSTDSQKSSIRAKNIVLNANGIAATVQTSFGEFQLHSTLLGRFNIGNLLAVTAILLSQHIKVEQISHIIPLLKPIIGRMQTFGGKDHQPLVVIDYAHTPDALKKALTSLRAHSKGKLLCLFGCGGDRDKTKRPLMGQIAAQHADQLIITNDNPRTEDPQQIIHDIKQGISTKENLIIEPDRKTAIKKAIALAEKNDIILIAGKGHEDYQIIGREKIHLSDIEMVEALLA